ncbi:hypothetical protein B0H65DRAFT_302657 [Neurospora tetraspora]|uniref:Uncharacterized protein n=1 Tax=Neurospora tetraspora TaxID=94610 RepID=A0AAE0MP92_9PEZI|nr:hypothetical protein B0H65DRAFT_302657 [Neurospora tetraspora]
MFFFVGFVGCSEVRSLRGGHLPFSLPCDNNTNKDETKNLFHGFWQQPFLKISPVSNVRNLKTTTVTNTLPLPLLGMSWLGEIPKQETPSLQPWKSSKLHRDSAW